MSLAVALVAFAASPLARAEGPAPAPAPAAAPAADGPTLAPCTVLQPNYTIGGKNTAIGTMWATSVGGKQVLVTAHSLFGPAGGLPAQFGPDEVVTKVTAATAYDSASPRTECARTKKALKVADAQPLGKGGASQDVAVFEVDPGSGPSRLSAVAPVPLAALPLADKAPKLDERVWVLSGVDGATGVKWPAKVVQVDAKSLYYQYDDGNLNLAGTTGAAVVNAAGQVVGMNVGGGKMEDGALIGSAVPLEGLKQRVTAAAAPPAP